MTDERREPPSASFEPMAASYTLYVPWETRLAREIPFLEKTFRERDARTILDAACGPGRHAVALAKRGFAVTGVDQAKEMLDEAREHASAEGVSIELVEATLEEMPGRLPHSFDGVICLGNALASLSSPDSVPRSVRSFASVLKPGGVAVTQTVDFSVVAPGPLSPSPVRHVVADGAELFFVKSFVRSDGEIFIHFVTVRKEGNRVDSEVRLHRMQDVRPSVLQETFAAADFDPIVPLGDYSGGKFVEGVSKDLILVATRGAPKAT